MHRAEALLIGGPYDGEMIDIETVLNGQPTKWIMFHYQEGQYFWSSWAQIPGLQPVGIAKYDFTANWDGLMIYEAAKPIEIPDLNLVSNFQRLDQIE